MPREEDRHEALEMDGNPYRSPDRLADEALSEARQVDETPPDASILVLQWLHDSLIGFVLIIAGPLLVGTLCRWLLPRVPIPYPLIFCLGLGPFLGFARWRGVLRFDCIDCVALLGWIGVYSLIDLLALGRDTHLAVVMIAGSVSLWLYLRGRRHGAPRSCRSSENTG